MRLFSYNLAVVCIYLVVYTNISDNIWQNRISSYKIVKIQSVYIKLKLRGLNPRADYTDRAAAAGRRS